MFKEQGGYTNKPYLDSILTLYEHLLCSMLVLTKIICFSPTVTLRSMLYQVYRANHSSEWWAFNLQINRNSALQPSVCSEAWLQGLNSRYQRVKGPINSSLVNCSQVHCIPQLKHQVVYRKLFVVSL